MEFSDKIKELRIEKGLTAKQAAEKIGITRSAYSNYEQGLREPDFRTLKKLCDLLETTADYLIGR